MGDIRPTIVVTGVAGHLGLRLLPQLQNFNIVGVDLKPPQTSQSLRFVRMDLGQETSCRELFLLLKESRAVAVVHLAFVMDPYFDGALDVDRMWQVNVAGTARVMEAISEANHDEKVVEKFIYTSSAVVYGPELPRPATEDAPLMAHTLPYAIHKKESDLVVQQRSPALRGCSAYMLRPQLFGGPDAANYVVAAFRQSTHRATASGKPPAKKMPALLPWGAKYLKSRRQFIHVDDVARLILHILQTREPESQRLTVLNAAGKGEPLSLQRCIEMAGTRVVRIPGSTSVRILQQLLWKFGASNIAPEVLPYLTGEQIVSTDRLRDFLGEHYPRIIQHTVAEAFSESVKSEDALSAPVASAAALP
ncbi:MAG: NAD(P)-dependent oxidoreductase [Acidobacteriales bacterium]|nr:NAD(P)-dependent oxidoreductase [Terriglobales bacterium]